MLYTHTHTCTLAALNVMWVCVCERASKRHRLKYTCFFINAIRMFLNSLILLLAHTIVNIPLSFDFLLLLRPLSLSFSFPTSEHFACTHALSLALAATRAHAYKHEYDALWMLIVNCAVCFICYCNFTFIPITYKYIRNTNALARAAAIVKTRLLSHSLSYSVAILFSKVATQPNRPDTARFFVLQKISTFPKIGILNLYTHLRIIFILIFA